MLTVSRKEPANSREVRDVRLNEVLKGRHPCVDTHVVRVRAYATGATHLLSRSSSIADYTNLDSILVQHRRTTVARARVSLWIVRGAGAKLLRLVCRWSLRG